MVFLAGTGRLRKLILVNLLSGGDGGKDDVHEVDAENKASVGIRHLLLPLLPLLLLLLLPPET